MTCSVRKTLELVAKPFYIHVAYPVVDCVSVSLITFRLSIREKLELIQDEGVGII